MKLIKYSLLMLPFSLVLSAGCAENVDTEPSLEVSSDDPTTAEIGAAQQAFTETACSTGTFDSSLATSAPGQQVSLTANPPYGTSTCTQAFRTLLTVIGANGGNATVRYNGPTPTTQAACNAISVAGRLWETDPHNPTVHNLRKSVSGNGIWVSGKCSTLQRSTGLFPINNGNDWRWVTQAKSGTTLQSHKIILASALN